jgi:hypothetical protein
MFGKECISPEWVRFSVFSEIQLDTDQRSHTDSAHMGRMIPQKD